MIEIPKKSFLKRFWWVWIILTIGLLIFGFTTIRGNQHDSEQKFKNKQNKIVAFQWPDPNAKTITTMPLDLSQISSIAKFRSCSGHDRSGYDFNRELETDRAMKHYFEPAAAFKGTTDKIKFIAPFDGTVVMVQRLDLNPDGTSKAIIVDRLMADGSTEQSLPQAIQDSGGRKFPGNDIQLMSEIDPNAVFGFNHVVFAREWKSGDRFKAGDLIGYSSLGSKDSDLDMDYVARVYKPEGDKNIEVLDSMFNHMTPAILAEFAKYGITPENIMFSKAERDAKPCGYDPVTKYASTVCQQSPNSNNGPNDNDCWIKLTD